MAVATGIAMIVCTVACWMLPRPIVGTGPSPEPLGSTAAAATVQVRDDDPCKWITGAAQEYRHAAGVEDAAPVGAISRHSTGVGAPWPPVFPALSIATAVGLCMTAGRPSR